MNLTTTHLFTKCLLERDSQTLRRINPDIFVSENDRIIYYTIFKYIKNYHAIPSISIVQEQTNNLFVPTDPGEDYPVDFIFDEVVEKLRKKYIQHTLTSASDPYNFELLNEISKVCKVADGKSIMYEEVDPESYFLEQTFLKTKFSPYISGNIGHIAGSDFLVFVGRMKSQKTHISRTLLLDLLSSGYNGVLFTNEITSLEYSGQLDALLAGILLKKGFNPYVFRESNPSEEVKKALKLAKEYRSEKLGRLLISGSVRSTDEYLSAVNRAEFPVDFIIVDGMHFMGQVSDTVSDKSQGLRNVSNATKMFCRDNNIPVIAVSQSNRSRQGKSRADTTTIGLTDAFAQDATAVFDCDIQEFTDITGTGALKKGVAIDPIANRYGDQKRYVMFTDWDTMRISFHRHPKDEETIGDGDEFNGSTDESEYSDPNKL